MATKTPYKIRMWDGKHWVDAYWEYDTLVKALAKKRAMMKESRRLGFKGTKGYDKAVFHGRKKVG